MKTLALLPLVLLLITPPVRADDQLRDVQAELKGLGFYYGEADGQANAETTAAIRRYQIRNGLEVTGTLNQETLRALGMGSAKSSKATPPKPAPAPVEKTAPPANLRRHETVEESDRNFLRREELARSNPGAVDAPRDPAVIDAPAPLEAPSPDFPVLFAGTPFADAPLEVQQQTLRQAQSTLASRGFYRDIVDGLPGPATEEALLTFQRANRLILTGRLDLATLNKLRLLPTGTDYSSAGGFRPNQQTFRGIWIERR